MEHIVRNLLVERGRIEQTVSNIVPEIEAAALFNVDQGRYRQSLSLTHTRMQRIEWRSRWRR